MVDAAPEDADVVVVNTCSVTATADQGARQTIRRIVRNNPAVKVIVTGCYATRRPDEIAGTPNVIRVVPNPGNEMLDDAIDSGYEPSGNPREPRVAGRTALNVAVQA